MLSSISPFGERARNSRWWLTVSAYMLGSASGGAAIGALFGLVGEAAGTVIGAETGLAVLAAAALLGVAVELGWFGWRVPSLLRRQVNEDWLTTYRGWVYGLGFGFQLGSGLATIVASSAVWLALAAAALSGSWVAGTLIGATFGVARGGLILANARVDDPERLRALFRTIAQHAPAVHRVATVSVALTAVTALGGLVS